MVRIRSRRQAVAHCGGAAGTRVTAPLAAAGKWSDEQLDFPASTHADAWPTSPVPTQRV
ncbi:hypothetical protein ACLOJK_039445 [Asimina triloba]